jgi:hypothetical protein
MLNATKRASKSLLTLKYAKIQAPCGTSAAAPAATSIRESPRPEGKHFGCGLSHANEAIPDTIWHNRAELGTCTEKVSFWREAVERGYTQ